MSEVKVLWRRKALLIFLVAVLHLGLIYSFGKSSASSNGTNDGSIAGLKTIDVNILSISRLNQIATSPSANIATLPQMREHTLSSTSLPIASPLLGSDQNFHPEKFLSAEELDQTATPQETFSAALGRSLPLKFDPLEVEFWIDSTGKTLQVNCVGENCTQDIGQNLQQLLALVFTPAVKNQIPVASRKRVLIEPAPAFGL